MILDTTRARARSRTIGRRDAHVGSDAVAQHVLRLDADINRTAIDLRAWKARVLADISSRVASGTFAPACVLGAPVISCMTLDEGRLNAWIDSTWDPWVARWKTYAAETTFYVWDDSTVDTFDRELVAHRAFVAGIDPKILVTPVSPELAREDSLFGGVADTVSSIVWTVGLGFVAYVVLGTVLPAILGAAGKTRNAYGNA